MLLNLNNMYIICIKDLISINGVKFHPIVLLLLKLLSFGLEQCFLQPNVNLLRFLLFFKKVIF